MLSKLEIEAYYIKIIGVTLVMTASCVSDAGAKQLTYEDIFRLVECREIVLTGEEESGASFSENSQLIYFHKPEQQGNVNGVLAQLANFFLTRFEQEIVLPQTLDWHQWKAFSYAVEDINFHPSGSLAIFTVSGTFPEMISKFNDDREFIIQQMFSGTNFKTRAGPSFLLS